MQLDKLLAAQWPNHWFGSCVSRHTSTTCRGSNTCMYIYWGLVPFCTMPLLLPPSAWLFLPHRKVGECFLQLCFLASHAPQMYVCLCQHVTVEDSYLCGYLKIKGLTEVSLSNWDRLVQDWSKPGVLWMWQRLMLDLCKATRSGQKKPPQGQMSQLCTQYLM